jgi:hypothetical protein
MMKKAKRENACPNCKAPLGTGTYCSRCGWMPPKTTAPKNLRLTMNGKAFTFFDGALVRDFDPDPRFREKVSSLRIRHFELVVEFDTE